MKHTMPIVLAISLLLIAPFTANAATATLNATQFLVNGELRSVPAVYSSMARTICNCVGLMQF